MVQPHLVVMRPATARPRGAPENKVAAGVCFAAPGQAACSVFSRTLGDNPGLQGNTASSDRGAETNAPTLEIDPGLTTRATWCGWRFIDGAFDTEMTVSHAKSPNAVAATDTKEEDSDAGTSL